MNVIAIAVAVLLTQSAPASSNLVVPPVAQAPERIDPPISWDSVGEDADLSPMMSAVLALADEEIESRIELIAINARASRDYAGALDMLNAIWVRAARGDTATPELMSLIALHRASALGKLGRMNDALVAAWSLFPDEKMVRAAVGKARIELGKDGARWESARANERLRELRATLRTSMEEPQQSDERWLRDRLDDDEALAWLAANVGLPSEPMADLVWKALTNTAGHQDNIRTLGLRSVPSLALFSLRQMKVVERMRRNPIVELDRLDSRLAAKLCTDWASAGDASWRLALLDVLSSKTANNSGIWTGTEEAGLTRGRLWENSWLEVFAPLLRDESVRRATVGRMHSVIMWNAVPPSAQKVLGDALRTTSAQKALELLAELETDYWAPCLIPVFEQALMHESVDVRHVAVERLSALHAVEEIVRGAREPDVRIRHLLAAALVASFDNRRIGTSVYKGKHGPEPTPAVVAIWSELLADSDIEVARTAARAIPSWISGVPEAVYRTALASSDEEIRRLACTGLAEDGHLPIAARAELWTQARTDLSPLVRRAAVACENLPPDLLGETLLALAVDDDATVRAAIDDILFDDSYGAAVGMAFALRAGHLDDPFQPGQGTYNDWKDCWRYIDAHKNVDAVRGAIASCDDVAIASLIEYLHDWHNAEQGGQKVLLQLEAPELAYLIAWSEDRPEFLRSFIDSSLEGSIAQPAIDAMRLLVLDPEQSLAVRLRALFHLDEGLWSTEAEDAFVQILEDPAWMSAVPASLLALNTYSERRNALAARVLRSESIERVVRIVATRALFSATAPEAQPVALLVLQSLGEGKLPERELALMIAALETISESGTTPGIARHLIAAARHPRLAGTAIEAMELQGELVYRESLAACLHSRAYDAGVQAAAATALVRYGNEAKPVLQEALLFAHPEALAYLHRALSALEAWEAQQRGVRGLGTRDEAIAELLSLIGHQEADVRAEAVRGIATFGAIEAIPRLIPLLHDPEPLVRAAARSALDRLHFSEGKAAEDADGKSGG